REPFKDAPDRNLSLQPCQWRTQTEVDSLAEGQVSIRAACDIQTIRVGKLSRVAVRGAQHQQDRITTPQPSPCQIKVLGDASKCGLRRAVVAQQLFDSGADKGRVRTK